MANNKNGFVSILIVCLVCLLITNKISAFQEIKANISDSMKTIRYTERIELKFNINTHNPKDFGYYHYKNDQDLGVFKIYKHNNYLYFVDGYHRNIKRYNIQNKEMINSIILNNAIENMHIINDTIYVVSSIEIFVLDIDLNYIKSKRYKIEDMPTKYTDDPFLDYKQIVINAHKIIKNKYGFFEVKENIPVFKNMCPSNVFYDSKSIVYYGMNKKQLIVYYYKY
jgi:hypothetical protein